MCVKIKCENNRKDVDTFYLIKDGKKIFLFDQGKRKGVEEYFGGSGVTIDRALKLPKNLSHNSDMRSDRALRRTIDKMPLYLRYVKKEYQISVMNTKRRNNK